MSDKLTPLGELPSDWSSVELGEISAFITKGSTPTTYGFHWVEDGVPFLRSQCVSDNGFIADGLSCISEDANNYLKRSEVRSGDILITITGNIGRVILYPYSLSPGNINQHIARVRVVDDDIDIGYIYCVLNTYEYRNYYNRITTGLAYPQISLAQVRETVIPKPPLKIQNRIARIHGSIDQ